MGESGDLNYKGRVLERIFTKQLEIITGHPNDATLQDRESTTEPATLDIMIDDFFDKKIK